MSHLTYIFDIILFLLISEHFCHPAVLLINPSEVEEVIGYLSNYHTVVLKSKCVSIVRTESELYMLIVESFKADEETVDGANVNWFTLCS